MNSPAMVRRSPLGVALLEERAITPDQLIAALNWQDAKGGLLGEALTALGYIKADQLEPFLHRQRRKISIGQVLVDSGLLDKEQLSRVLACQRQKRCTFRQALLELSLLQEEVYLPVLARHLDLPFLSLRHYSLPIENGRLLPESHARRLQALVVEVEVEGDSPLVAMVDPTDVFAYDELVRLLNGSIRQAMVSPADLNQAMDRLYRAGHAIEGDVVALAKEMDRGVDSLEQALRVQTLTDVPVARLLQALFEDAVNRGASDIHVEPDEDVLRIRLRVDGVLQERLIREVHIAPALVSKLKLMAGLEISERRLPQDGRFRMTVAQKNIDVRLATLPVQDGESVVLRLLDQSADHLKLVGTGLPAGVIQGLSRLAARGQGLILVTGPTGSGKTTTLYGLLAEINQPGVKIITVEDPVEYRLQRANQVQVNNRIQLTFANVLRHVLRQDPDVILVGEMRDGETAETAITAALTGHLVLSTLHTRDAVSSISRLLDLGVPGYGIAASLLGVLSQRLVRRVCQKCARPWQPDPAFLPFAAEMLGDLAGNWLQGQGCSQCGESGYQGRVAVAELLVMTPPLAQALRDNDIQAFTHRAGQGGLFQTGLHMARQGITTLAEVARLAPLAEGEIWCG